MEFWHCYFCSLLPFAHTITGQYYADLVPKVWSNKSRMMEKFSQSVLFYQENAHHLISVVFQYLPSRMLDGSFKDFKQVFYSLDLVLDDYFLFKEHLGQTHVNEFMPMRDCQWITDVNKWLSGQEKGFFLKIIRKLVQHTRYLKLLLFYYY